MSEQFDIYINCLVNLHEEMARNEYKGNDEGDSLREILMEMEHLLNEEESRWAHNLGGDLYMLYGQSMYYRVEQVEGRKILLYQQIRSQDWLGVLDSVRAALGLPEYAIAIYRGLAWSEKSPKVSLLFFKFADKLIEGQKSYRVVADHPILARQDKVVRGAELEAYKNELRLAGYENISEQERGII